MWDGSARRGGLRCCAAWPCALVVTVPLDFWQQVGFAAVCFALAVWLNKVKEHLATLMMVVLSIAASSRYVYWRLTETVGLGGWFDAAFGIDAWCWPSFTLSWC
ncbi:hypothetical protein ACU4GD_13275 [Cupriavidus basilensis]